MPDLEVKDLCSILSQSSKIENTNYEELADLAIHQEIILFFLEFVPLQSAHFSDKFRDKLRQIVRNASHLSLLQTRAVIQINRQLEEKGIRAIWLKGTVLAHTLYKSPQLRPMLDLDFLVSPEDYPRAIEILEALAYERLGGQLDTASEKLSHHLHLVDKESGFIHVEVHHRLLGHSGKAYLAEGELQTWMEKASSFSIKNERLYCLANEYHFLYLCAHAFLQHGEAQIKLRHLLDLDLMLRKSNLDWSLLLETASRLSWNYLLLQALQRVQDYFSSPIPDGILENLQNQAFSNAEVFLIDSLEDGDIRGEKFLRQIQQLNFQEKISTIFKVAFPPAEYMRSRYAIPAKSAIWPYYFSRWAGQIVGMVKTLQKRIKAKRR